MSLALYSRMNTSPGSFSIGIEARDADCQPALQLVAQQLRREE
jgi:hypothetical protein